MGANLGNSAIFERCLKHGKIKEFSRGQALAGKEAGLAKADLARGRATYGDGDYKWSTVQAYYSMFHSARALLYRKNYREKSHACLIVAIKYLYAESRELSLDLIEAIIEAKRLREDADYYGDFSKELAEDLLDKAEKFLKVAKKIIKA
jgi:uncharacterized protein (UPF0332 family)